MNRFSKIHLGKLLMLAVTTANAAEDAKSIVIYFSHEAGKSC
jgi:hypothetical protein